MTFNFETHRSTAPHRQRQPRTKRKLEHFLPIIRQILEDGADHVRQRRRRIGRRHAIRRTSAARPLKSRRRTVAAGDDRPAPDDWQLDHAPIDETTPCQATGGIQAFWGGEAAAMTRLSSIGSLPTCVDTNGEKSGEGREERVDGRPLRADS